MVKNLIPLIVILALGALLIFNKEPQVKKSALTQDQKLHCIEQCNKIEAAVMSFEPLCHCVFNPKEVK